VATRNVRDFNGAVPHVRRVKNGTPSTHPIQGDELRALRRLQRESVTSPFVFVSERGSPFTTPGFARRIERAAATAGLELKTNPHMFRHACGYALANKGHDTRASPPECTRHLCDGLSAAILPALTGRSPRLRSSRLFPRLYSSM
jgi:integrase